MQRTEGIEGHMARRRAYQDDEPRRRRRKTLLWHKMVYIGLVAVFGFVVFRVCAKTIRPVILCCSLRNEVRQLDARAKSLTQENEALRLKRKYLMSPQGAETEARKLGFVRPGEVSIILQDEKTPAKK
jgi:cell division protein FtsB